MKYLAFMCLSLCLTGCPEIRQYVAFNDVNGRIIQSADESTHLDANAGAKLVEDFEIVITADVCYGSIEGAKAVFDFSDVPGMALVAAIAGADFSVITVTDGDSVACEELGIKVRSEVKELKQD